MATWHDLPTDIWSIIFRKLTLTEHIPFSGVCKLWRSMVMDYRNIKIPTQVPGLIIPASANTSSQVRHFLAYPVGKSINKEHDLPILSIPHQNLCRGSYQGWLVMVTNAMDMYLHNPLTGARIDLPHVTTLPRPLRTYHKMSKWFIEKAILSAAPSSSDCFVVVFYGFEELAVCKVGDRSWKEINNSSGFIDGIFYNNKFYTVNFNGRIYVADLADPQSPTVNVLDIPPPRDIPYVNNWYLVELDGQLLQILRETDLCGDVLSNDDEAAAEEEDGDGDGDDDDNAEEEEDDDDDGADDHDNAEEGEEEAEEGERWGHDDFDDYDYDNNFTSEIRNFTHQTTAFEVYKLETSSSELPKWVELKDLNGGAIFLGTNQSFGLPSASLTGYKGDRIYYTDDRTCAHKLFLCSGNDMGVFHLGDSNFELLYLNSAKSTKPHPVWFTPTLW